MGIKVVRVAFFGVFLHVLKNLFSSLSWSTVHVHDAENRGTCSSCMVYQQQN